MELPEIGKQCAVETCQQLDLLPIKCENCLKYFCKNHNLLQYHNCLAKPIDTQKNDLSSLNPLKHPCSVSHCSIKELSQVICPHCSKNFCLKHRHQVDHDCPEYLPAKNPMEEAAAKIEELTKTLGTNAPKKAKKVKNEKLAAKVQLMKLKGKAVGNNGLPQEERLFFLIHYPKRMLPKEPLSIFVSHHWSVGRSLDAISDLAKVPNRNNETGAQRLELFRLADGSLVKPLDSSLKLLLDREEIYNGQSLILEYVDKGTVSLEQPESYILH